MASIREEIVKIFDQSQESYFEIDQGIDKLRTVLFQATLGEKVRNKIILFCFLIIYSVYKDNFLADFTNSIVRCTQIVLVSNDTIRSNLVIEFLVQILIQFDKSDLEHQVKNQIILYLFSV